MNVWVALAHEIHPHHDAAVAWGKSLPRDATPCFCRITQLGLLRLLTNPSAMGGDVQTQAQAWAVYDGFLRTAGARMLGDPQGIDAVFRQQTRRNEVSTKQWADGYLAAFSMAAEIPLVTFDHALAGKVKGTVLLS